MRPRLAARLSRALVGCYPPRWQQRYREEMLDVLDQHRAGSRTVLSLAGGAVTAHLDPSYRLEWPLIHIKSKAARAALVAGTTCVALIVGVYSLFTYTNVQLLIGDLVWHPGYADGASVLAFTPDQRVLATLVGSEPDTAVVILSSVGPTGLRQLSSFEGGVTVAVSPDGRLVGTSAYGGIAVLWNVAQPRHPARVAVLKAGSSNALWGEAFSPDSRLLAIAYGGSAALWDVARPDQPRLLDVLNVSVGPVMPRDIAFSPDGRFLVLASGDGQATIWNVTRPARATPVATITGQGGYFQALAFAPQGDLLAGVTTPGTVQVYRLDDQGHPTLTASRPGLAARALYPGGVGAPAGLASSCPGCTVPSYALGFAPGGRALTVVLDYIFPDNSSRDTAFTWLVTASGGLADGTSAARDAWDGQPGLAPDGRTIVDGAAFGRTTVGLWELPATAGRP